MKGMRAVCVLAILMLLSACAALSIITQEDVSQTPTVYARVNKAPNPALMGHWRRPQPAGINKPWVFHYWLVESGGKYAVYYAYDSRRKASFKGWADFSIDGDTMTSGVDGVSFFVQGGDVYMNYPGRDKPYRMERVD